jgi:hypothetical protein
MKPITLILAVALASFSVVSFAKDTNVDGYYRNDGAYVQPHTRSETNKSYNDNWSTSPNTNPNTGKQGTNSPTWDDKAPARKKQNW